MKIAYYVSGHGYGHATRSVEVVRQLLLLLRGQKSEVVIVSAAPRHIFEEILVGGGSDGDCTFRQSTMDAGGVKQLNPFDVDVEGTRGRVEAALLERENIVQREAEWIAAEGVDGVVVDVAFFPIQAATRANVPSVIVSNFTWDSIYAPFVSAEALARITADYACASLIVRLPGWIDIPCSATVPMVTAPLLVRSTMASRAAVRERFDLPLDARVVLIQFGGHEYKLSWGSLKLPEGWFGLVCGPASSLDPAALPAFMRHVPESTYLPDVLVGKLGYGTCSEALIAGTPLVFIRRRLFVEEPGLEAMLQSYGLPAAELVDIASDWVPIIESVHSQRSKLQWPSHCTATDHPHPHDYRQEQAQQQGVLCTHGAKVAAQHIVTLFTGEMTDLK